MSHLVFVFGTLKQGFPNFSTNKGVRVGGDFITVQRYPLYLMGERCSPWMLDSPGEGEQIVGQVFAVDPDALHAMDVLERIAEADGYRREEIEVETLEDDSPQRLRVHVYVKPAQHFSAAQVRLGPLQEYTKEHALLYRSRIPAP